MFDYEKIKEYDKNKTKVLLEGFYRKFHYRIYKKLSQIICKNDKRVKKHVKSPKTIMYINIKPLKNKFF